MSGKWVENIFMLGSPCCSRDHKTNQTENTLENGWEKWAWQEQKGDKRGFWAGSWSDWIWYVYKIIYYLILSCQTIDLIKNKLGRGREKSATSWMLCWYLYLYISPLQMMVMKSRWISQSHPTPKYRHRFCSAYTSIGTRTNSSHWVTGGRSSTCRAVRSPQA